MRPIAATRGAGRRDFFWLDGNLAMASSSPSRGLGFNLGFGGIFTSVPAVVGAQAQREARALGTAELGTLTEEVRPTSGPGVPAGAALATATVAASAVPRTAVAGAHVAAQGRHDIEVGGVLAVEPRVDVFGLGLDYALYHKRLWGTVDVDERGPWQPLGGTFTSSPTAIVWAGTRIEVLGVGLDHAMYMKTSTGNTFTPEWQRLGGAFTSAAALVARGPELNAFARGADFKLRGNHTDGATWFGWQNHGGQLASAPAAVSWGPDRIDVFAVFRDGALWHLWWDGEFWNDWESLGGNYVGEPAAVSWGPGRLDVFAVGAADHALYHHVFDGQAWSAQPERINPGTTRGLAATPTALSPGPGKLELFAPIDDHQIRIGTWEGQGWDFGAAGASWRAPSRYRISVDRVEVKTARALDTDTDGASATLNVGNAQAQICTQWIGDIGGGAPKASQTNLLVFDGVVVELAEPVSFSYLVVNNGHAGSDKVLKALASASDSLGLASSSSMQEDIGKGIAQFVSVKLVGATAVALPVVGSVVAPIEAWLLGKLTEAIFQSCDGIVAAENRAMNGRDLFLLTGSGQKKVTIVTDHSGTDAPSVCGNRSHYLVTWTVQPL